MNAQDTPMGLALIPCDSVIEDKTSDKKSLIGLCNRIVSNRFPCTSTSLSIYTSLTNGRGKYNCEITCRHNDYQTVAFSAEGTVLFDEPTEVVDLVFRLQNIRFVKPGTYWLHFLIDNMPIMMRPLQVDQIRSLT